MLHWFFHILIMAIRCEHVIAGSFFPDMNSISFDKAPFWKSGRLSEADGVKINLIDEKMREPFSL